MLPLGFQALSGECGFLAANLYAKSIFGEDALANVSIEKPFGDEKSKVQGHVRIRAKTQVSNVPLNHVYMLVPHTPTHRVWLSVLVTRSLPVRRSS